MVVLIMLPDELQTERYELELDNFLAYLGGRIKDGGNINDVMRAALDVVVEYAEEVGGAERIK